MKIKNLFSLMIAMLPLVMVGCKESGNNGNGGNKAAAVAKTKKTSRKTVLTPSSSGIPYEILVVADGEDYYNGAYDALKEVLESDVPGLPQAEPSFRISKVSSNDFHRTLRYCRNILFVNIDPIYSQGKIKFSRDVYASPQMVMTIQAQDAKQFAKFVTDNGESIIDFFTKAEMNREIELLKKKHSLFISQKVDSLFDCEVWIPQELNKTKTAKNFFWAATNKGEKDMNFVIYSYPYRDVNTFTKEYFFAKRDSVMKRYIPGPKKDQYMTTAHQFVTVKDSEVRGEYAQIARGLWEMENYDMGGPFVSISRVDEKNQMVIVAEAFVYAPGDDKRNLMRRMEAALYTLTLPEEKEVEKFSYGIEEITIVPE